MSLDLSFSNNQTRFFPGQWIEGNANWNLRTPPRSIEFRLIWFTQGKGNRDFQIVATQSVQTSAAMGDAPFRFQLPDAPHSFSGTLVSLTWAVEAILTGDTSTLREFTLSPTGEEIVLPRLEQTQPDMPAGIKKFVESLSNRRSGTSSTSVSRSTTRSTASNQNDFDSSGFNSNAPNPFSSSVNNGDESQR